MKQFMIDMMAAMMPYMRPIAMSAAALLVIGIIGRLAGARSVAQITGALVVAIGVFFLACEGAGRLLGFEPTVLFALPADRVLYRNQWPFWTIGGAALVAGLILRMLGAGGRR